MIVVDTSAWIEFLRGTGSDAHRVLASAVAELEDIGVPDVVRLELLAGAGTSARAQELRALLARFTALPAASPADHDSAAALYQAARRTGQTVRSLLDCLVAASALRIDGMVLASDRDFHVLADVSPLRLVRL